MPVSVACGQCTGCRLEYSRQWAVRIMHEAQMHEENCFVTLTYADEHLPPGGSLDRRAFPLFMKRLRKANSGRRIRYYQCGEYGELGGRPHYHGCLFGIDFRDDRVHWRTSGRGDKTFRSGSLEAAWPYGQSEIGELTFESAAYVARYVVKKVRGAKRGEAYKRIDSVTGELFELEPEHATMSRRPGIGREWMERYGQETYRHDSVVMRGREMRPPSAYDRMYEEINPERVRELKLKRRRHVDLEEETFHRRAVREACAIGRLIVARELREDGL